jgi:PAS domain S-box-containing protein
MAQFDRVLLPVISVVILAIIAADVVTPRGVAVGALYVVPVLLAVGFADRRRLIAVAIIATILNVAGYVISPPMSPWWMGPINRTIATVIIWAVAALGWSRATAMRSSQAERDRWHATLASIGDAVAVTDAAGRMTYLNGVAEQLSGWRFDDARGRRFDDVLRFANAETRKPVENPIARVLAEGRVSGLANHTLLLRRDGTDVPIDDSAAPIRDLDGAVSGAVIVFRDVTDRYRTDARLKDAMLETARRAAEAETARQTLEALMAYIPEGITIADAPDVRVRMVSRYGLELVQRDAHELVGPADSHPTSWGIFRLDGTKPTSDELPLTRAVLKGEVISNEPWILRRPDGKEIIVSCNAGPIGEGDHVGGGVIAWRDVTEQHLMQQELQRQAEALREHDRMKDTFVSMVSHELRQPLNALRTATGMIRAYADGIDRMARPVLAIERQISHLTRLVDDLLDASRLTFGKFTLEPADIDFADVVREAADTLQSTADAREVSLDLRLPAEPLLVRGDAGRLRQVLLNLVTNAVRHTDPGGTVTVTLQRDREEATFTVRDTGRGIAPELLPRLFDMFVQGQDAGVGSAGMGLGLAIAKGIVELHKGTIVARSDGPGTGAEFEIRLPLAAAVDDVAAG